MNERGCGSGVAVVVGTGTALSEGVEEQAGESTAGDDDDGAGLTPLVVAFAQFLYPFDVDDEQ